MSGIGRAVGGLFGGGAPQAQPVPVAPANDPEAEARRRAAADQAIADQKARGRASTMAAGEEEAANAQYGRGLLKREQRLNASQGLLG